MKEAFHIRITIGFEAKHGTVSVLVYQAIEATSWFDRVFDLIPEEHRPGTTITVSHRNRHGTWHAVKTIPWNEFQGLPKEQPP